MKCCNLGTIKKTIRDLKGFTIFVTLIYCTVFKLKYDDIMALHPLHTGLNKQFLSITAILSNWCGGNNAVFWSVDSCLTSKVATRLFSIYHG